MVVTFRWVLLLVAALFFAATSTAADALEKEEAARVLTEHGVALTPQGVLGYLESQLPSAASQEEIAKLIDALGDDAFVARETAEKKLAQLGAAAADALQRATESDDAEIRFRAERLLKQFDEQQENPPTAAAFVWLLHTEQKAPLSRLVKTLPLCSTWDMQRTAGNLLNEIATIDDLPELKALAQHESAGVRAAAVPALCRLTKADELEAAAKHLEDPAPEVRLAAACALANRGERRALPTLVQLLDEDSVDVRRGAFMVLVPLTGKHFDYPVFAEPRESEAARGRWKKWLQEEADNAELHFPVKDHYRLRATLALAHQARSSQEIDFAETMRSIAPQLDELQIGTRHGEAVWHQVPMNLFGEQMSAFRFTVPKGEPRDLCWAFSYPPKASFNWYILPVDAPFKGGFRNFHNTGDAAPNRGIVQHLPADKLVPGKEYLMWFSFNNQLPAEVKVALNLLPAGEVKNEGEPLREALGLGEKK